MKLIVNYLCVSLYYAIGLLISLKYLFLYFVQVCSGASRPAEDLEDEDVSKDSKFDFHEETLKIKEQNVHFNFVSAGSPKNPLMLFLHGFPESWYIWKHQMSEFSHEYWTVAVDIKTNFRTIADRYFLVDSLKVFLDHLGRNRCILIGRDFGGSLVWSFLDKYPELVVKSIIINAPHPAVFKQELKKMSQLIKTSPNMFYLIPKLPEWHFSRKNYHKLDTLYKDAELSAAEMNTIKYHFKKNNSENLKNGLTVLRSNFIADTIFRPHSKISTAETYPQVLVIYTKSNPKYNDACFAHNFVKQALQVTEIQTKHGHYFQLNERSSKLLNKIIRDYFENPSKWDTDWNEEDKTTSGNVLKENFDEHEKEKVDKENVGEVFDKLIKQCNETIEDIKEDMDGKGEKKRE
ncbi:hypothetical protein M8J77_014585 [Diaphorina citri]|nr:hypothetical protein M8J77_014585 [Diaphorina citri]